VDIGAKCNPIQPKILSTHASRGLSAIAELYFYCSLALVISPDRWIVV